jgi:hypothetical protein
MIPAGAEVYAATRPIDFRKSPDGLAALVRDTGAAALPDYPEEMRIRAICTERWVGFARARRLLELMQALRDHPPSTRSPWLAIFAYSGMGKTMLVEKFRRNPPTVHPARGMETIPVLGVTLTSRPTERRICAQILTVLDIGVEQRRRHWRISRLDR